MNVHDFEGLAKKLKGLNDEIVTRVLRNIVEGLGESLLNEITDEIGEQDIVDTGTMWNSFERGDKDNMWEWDIDRNSITLEVGSGIGKGNNDPNNWNYPRLVNEGYTIHKAHFVPGVWENGRFEYDSKSDKGFMARPRSFIGRHYFDIALRNFEGEMNELILEKLEKELERMLS